MAVRESEFDLNFRIARPPAGDYRIDIMNTAMTRRWWKAAQQRDPAFDGKFVFGVVTTGVYCRPSCPARRPRLENIRLYSDAPAAELEGFRPCKRCRPRSHPHFQPDAALAARACSILADRGGRVVPLAEIARTLGVSPHHLQKMFRRALGVSPREYQVARRFEEFRRRAGQRGDVAGALYAAGFSSPSRLYERSGPRLGMTPAALARGGEGVSLAYDVISCPLGRALLAATPRGLCAVELGDSDRALIRSLTARYPRAVIQRNAGLLRGAAGVLHRIFRDASRAPALPLDVCATAFQARVWNELQAIPAGATQSYGQIARRLGRPNSARAVARACASNPVAVLIPCHRAVAADGGLSGYRWGRGRKKALLRMERRHSPS